MVTVTTVLRITPVITQTTTASEDSGSSEPLTSSDYWEDYYRGHRSVPAQRQSIEAAASRYDRFWEAMYSYSANPQSVCEIGCYPGRYLAYVAAKFDLKAVGIDFNSDLETVRRNMATMGVRDCSITNADFLQHTPQQTSDLVFSLGFVEHFYNIQEILDQHLQYMSPQGVLFIAIPNMRGLIRPYKLLVDKANLEIHNLESMRLSVFRDFAERNHLTTHLLEYQSGFPANVHQVLNFTQKLIYYPTKFLAKRLDPLIQRRPAGLYSGEIVAMFTR